MKIDLLLVDGFSLLFRGYFATAAMRDPKPNSKGLYTNALEQFLRYFDDAVERFSPTHVACALDAGKTTFRNEWYPDYKANRGAPPDPIVPQFSMLTEMLESMDVPALSLVNFEADDLIGTLAHRFSEEGVSVTILTGDGDALQLIGPNRRVALMKRGFGHYEIIHEQNFTAMSELEHPWQVVELKGLMGDASDHIPGCPGVGPKTAKSLLQAFGSIDAVYENISQVKGKIKDKLAEHEGMVRLSRRLAEIKTNVEISCLIDDCAYGDDLQGLIHKLEEWGCSRMVKQYSENLSFRGY